jgi:spore coat protein U-like protein
MTRRIKRRLALTFLAAVALALGGRHDAASAAMPGAFSAMGVGARIDVRCVVIGSIIVFPGSYESGQSTPIDGQGSVYVDCEPGRPVWIRLDQGQFPAPGSTNNNPLRRMRHGLNASVFMQYNLYEDAARTTVWSGRNPGFRIHKTWPAYTPVYGRIFPGQTVIPGTYQDVVVAVLYW